ncbi:hypothetical protein M5K25_001097 [Dendrobium thyrsiflorum]|uniref:Uncharacterized protein n=1 Tax=Dendrobium thyrsiflorum TaxID=117978 RepID=A0ABD0VV55_DENTH
MVVDESSSGTNVDSPFLSSELSLSLNVQQNGIVPLVDVLVSLITNDELKTQLLLNMKDNYLDHSDWLDGSVSSPTGGVGEDLDGSMDEFLPLYSLKVGQIVDNSSSRGSGKRGRRKSRKK